MLSICSYNSRFTKSLVSTNDIMFYFNIFNGCDKRETVQNSIEEATSDESPNFNPLTAGAAYIRVFIFLLAH